MSTGPRPDTGVEPTPSPAGRPQVNGVDLSLTGTGLSNGTWCRTIRTVGADSDDWPTRAARLRSIATDVLDAVRGADLVVIEAPAYSRNTGKAFDRAGLWWQVYLRLHRLNIPIAVVTAGTRARYATGRGNADKFTVTDAVRRRYPHVHCTDHNQIDALVLAAMGLDRLGRPPAAVPVTHRAALTAVAWPGG